MSNIWMEKAESKKTKNRIIKCIKALKGEFFDETSHLVSGGWLDSFELLELIVELEKEFNIKIPLMQVSPENFDNIKEIENVLAKL